MVTQSQTSNKQNTNEIVLGLYRTYRRISNISLERQIKPIKFWKRAHLILNSLTTNKEIHFMPWSKRCAQLQSSLYRRGTFGIPLTARREIMVSYCFILNPSGWGTEADRFLVQISSARRRKLFCIRIRMPSRRVSSKMPAAVHHVRAVYLFY